MASIRDVAKYCGVTPMTVSLVLNKPEKISPPTRDKVLQAVRDMGYRARAQRPPPTNSQTIGVLNKEHFAFTGYASDILNGIILRVYDLDQNLLFFPGRTWEANPNHSVRVNCDGKCDGMIFITALIDDPIIPILRGRGTPFVVVGGLRDAEDVATVDVDDIREGYRVTEYLIGLGHRRIAFVGASHYTSSPHLRCQGYKDALEAHGISVDPQLVFDPLEEDNGYYNASRSLLALPTVERPTAIFGWNDLAASDVIRAAHDARLRVPDDVSVMGFDDGADASASKPTLTSVRQPYADLGREAVDLVLSLMQGGKLKKIMLPATIIERESTAPPSRF